MATKEQRRQVRSWIEELELRVHLGPPVRDTELHSAQEFLRQNAFAPNSDYFGRLSQIRSRLLRRAPAPPAPAVKRNYGGIAGGRWMQLLSIYDHVILSTCYEGEFATRRGKIKISHRFNRCGRIDFVELKFLHSLHECLDGEVRTLLRVKNYQEQRPEWWAAEAFVLPVLPRELVFLHAELFRFARVEVLAWLVNIGHGLADDLLQELRQAPADGESPRHANGEQMDLKAARHDPVALPILEQATKLEAAVELADPKNALIRYVSRR